MGSGKALVAALLAVAWDGPVVVTAPTQYLTEQLGATLRRVGLSPGLYYQHERSLARVVVCCGDSLDRLMLEHRPDGLLWVADEAHRTESLVFARFAEVASHRLALSATPYLSDPKAGLSLWTHEVYRYALADAIRDGVLVMPSVVRPVGSGTVDLDEWCIEQAERAEGPGVISAESTADADAFVRRLTVPAMAVHYRSGNRARAVAALEAGDIKAIVHVRMLSEGVDLPWLRWSCLRASKGSRVEVHQSVGRVMRSHPGKAAAVVYDPHGLVATHGLQDMAQLGAPAAGPRKAKPTEQWELIDPLTGEPLEWDATPPERRKRIKQTWEAWDFCDRLVVALTARGVLGREVVTGPWRAMEATERQRKALVGFGRIGHAAQAERGRLRHVKTAEGAAVVLLVARAVRRAVDMGCRRGVASDLVSAAKVVLAGENWNETLVLEIANGL
jgi:superfamily II DNA or RNA helicase